MTARMSDFEATLTFERAGGAGTAGAGTVLVYLTKK
jgi:hypothetical protein